jgi:PAS domain S-box-containing protein
MRSTRSLSARLAEAKATIQALLSGQIDAVVDPNSQTPVLLAQAQKALRDERDHAQRCLNTPDVFLVALDMDARITLINRYACAVLGWTATELIGRSWIETCIPHRERNEFTAAFADLVAGNLPVRENLILTRSGDERLIEWRNTVIRAEDGSTIGTFSSGADITEQARASRAVGIAEERMRFALESAGVGIWDMDYVTGELQWSPTLEAQYGLAKGTFPRTYEAFIDLIHPEDRQLVLETIDQAMQAGSDFSVLSRAVWPDGSVHWLRGTGRVVLDGNGRAVRGVGVSQDVTARRSLEEQFLQAQKMEAIGRLAGGVAHDFNNLLTVILGFCELLIADLPEDDRRRTDVGEIQKAGMSATRLTGQLLAFSRKEILEPKLLDLNEVVVHMRGMLARLIGEDMHIHLKLCPDPVPVKADRGHLEQVLMNLAVNGRDAMVGGGTLTIATTLVAMKTVKDAPFERPGVYAMLTVKDTGAGMTPEVLARLFEPFFTTKPAGQGTGLGLATVQGIVSRNHGKICVFSEVGKGTAFTVYLPKAHEVERADDVANIRTQRATAMVLVVEDSDGLRALTKKMLERQGYTVLVAATADEAVRLFEANEAIAVVLTDVVMPGTSGPELTRRLVEQRPALKVIYMSGYTDDAIAHHGVLKPGIAFVHKPFTGEALGRKIREVLDR